MSRLPAALIVLAALVVPASASSPAATRTFGGWTAACNNLGACVVTAAADDSDGLMYLQVLREAGADAPPRATIVRSVQDAKGPYERFRLTAVDGARKTDLPPVVAAQATKDDPSTIRGNVPPGVATLGLIEAIRNAMTLEVSLGKDNASLDLKGLSAALRFVDDRQGRVGGPSALVVKGMTPTGQIPGPTPPPALAAAPAGSVSPVAKPIVTPALLALATKACDADTVKAHEDLKAWRLSPDRLLVAVPCQSGAYNFQSALYFTDAKGSPTGPVNLQQPASSDDAPNLITNGDFDPKTMELSTFAKGRGIGDCGLAATWVWTSTSFALLTASGLDSCPGALPEDWPNLYTATKR